MTASRPIPSASRIREILLNDEEFLSFAKLTAKDVVKRSIHDDEEFREFMGTLLEAFTIENCMAVKCFSESPIEKIFLRSLIMTFLANGRELVVHEIFEDTETEVAEFRKTLEGFRELLQWFKENKPAPTIHDYIDMVFEQGGVDEDGKHDLIRMLYRYHYLDLSNSWHMSIQPRFPNIKADGKSIRADIYFWIPANPQAHLIVECDGFKFHSDKIAFSHDRARDRALKMKGFEVLRFSGSEIYNDPVGMPVGLAEFLRSRNPAESRE